MWRLFSKSKNYLKCIESQYELYNDIFCGLCEVFLGRYFYRQVLICSKKQNPCLKVYSSRYTTILQHRLHSKQNSSRSAFSIKQPPQLHLESEKETIRTTIHLKTGAEWKRMKFRSLQGQFSIVPFLRQIFFFSIRLFVLAPGCLAPSCLSTDKKLSSPLLNPTASKPPKQ